MPVEPSRVVPKESLAIWIGRLLEEGEVIAPLRGPAGEEVFGSVRRPEDVLWDFVNPLDPPKRFLLPQTEPLASIRRDGGRVEVEPLADDTPRVLLNVRSCDLTGILFLRGVLSQDLPDEAFLERAASFTLVSLACTTPCPLGFCVCCGAGPFLRGGFDLQLIDLGDVVMAEVGSKKGHRLLELGEGLFREPGVEELRDRSSLEETALRSFGPVTCHFGSAMRRISTRRVEETLWQAMTPWCLECGGCNLACPTCFCFSVKDRALPTPGEAEDAAAWVRCRIWDSCQYEAFTMEASGHNPRASKAERMKRRFHHKVSAQYYQRDGALGCVGCGRCIKVCMGTTHMPAVVEAIREGAWKGLGVREEAVHV